MPANRKAVIFLILAVLFFGLFFRYLNRAPKRHYCDFRVYYATGQRFAARENIYERPDESITPFKYSPMFAMLMWPLSFFSAKTASLIFFTINFAALIIVFVLSRKLLPSEELSFRETMMLYTLSALFSLRFIMYVLDSGQVGILIMALVLSALYFLHEHKNALSAALLGLSTMFKYTSSIFLPYFLLRKRVKLVILAVLFILLYCLLPALYTGMEREIEYVKSWLPFITQTSFDGTSLYDYKNQSLFAFILRFFTNATTYNVSLAGLNFGQGLVLTFVVTAFIYLLIVIPGRRHYLTEPIDYSLLFVGMFLFNPNAWMHNLVVSIFVYMTLFYYLIKTNFKDKFILLLVAFSFLLMTLTSETFVGDRLEGILEEFSSVTIGAMVLMVSLFRLKFKKI